MRIHELQHTEKRKNQKRVGRGGKRGTYSGHGEKGQRKRSGHRIRPAERDLIMRIPKLRGVKHGPVEVAAHVINVGDLERIFMDGTITRKLLVEKKIIGSLRAPVKILANGDVKKPFVIDGVPLSKSAKAKIEKAGGSVK